MAFCAPNEKFASPLHLFQFLCLDFENIFSRSQFKQFINVINKQQQDFRFELFKYSKER